MDYIDKLNSKMSISPGIYRDGLNDKDELAGKILLFCISPFLAFLYSLRRPASNSSYVIYFLFGIIFCWNMDERDPTRYDDFSGIMDRFKEESYTTGEISRQIYDTVNFNEDAPKELFENILNWFTKLFTDNYHVFFALASVFYLTFMLSSLRNITGDRRFKGGFYGLLVMALFVLPRDIITVQNPRYTVGFWYCILCIIGFLKSKASARKKYCIMIMFAPFFHSAFWPFIILFYLGVWSTNLSLKKLMSIYFVSIPFSLFSYDLIKDFDVSILPLPKEMLFWVERYLSEDYYNRYSVAHGSGLWLIDAIFNFYKSVVYVLVPIFIWKKVKGKSQQLVLSENKQRLLSFFIFLTSIINVMQPIPVIGTRYGFFSQVLAAFVLFKLLYPNKKLVMWLASAWIYPSFKRYLFKGAVASCVPPDIWMMPLPYIIFDGI